jgi:hypothetical protein
MAEILDIEINIGANTEDLSAELQKAENLLSKLQAKLKKSTDVGEIQKLNAKISSVEGSIGTLSSRINGVAKPTNDATNALSNLSRVAQDAPYGFIGIANNLNPLLESFQRLQTRSGSATEALKSMAAGLVGPAGIGLALGVVSSLAVTFSDEIAAFFIGPTEKLKKFREELNKLNQDIYKIVGEAQANRTIGLNLVSVIAGGTAAQQEEALKKLKILYKDSKDIQALKIGADNAYITHLVNMASKQEEYNAKEKNNAQALSLIYENQKKTIAERDKALNAVKGDKITGGGAGGGASVVTAEQQKTNINKRYDPILKELEKQIVSAKSKNLELVNALSVFETPDKKEPKDSEAVTYAKYELKKLDEYVKKLKERVKEAQFVLKNESFQLYQSPSEKRAEENKRKPYFDKLLKENLEKSNESGLGAFLMKDAKARIISYDAEDKKLKDLIKSYEDFSMTIASNVTNAFVGMYEAMQQGVSFGDALGQMFGRLAQQIAETLVQAAIFAGIFSLISGGAGATGGLSFFGAFTKILGLASGGVATGPTLAMIGEGSESEAVLPLSKLGNIMQGSFNAGSMNTNSMAQNGQFVLKGNDLVLALQRSNYSLNLRRGV